MRQCKCSRSVRVIITSANFVHAILAGLTGGAIAIALHRFNAEQGGEFLPSVNPDIVVFNVFIIFASLIAGFRTSHALHRHSEAAGLLHRLMACWFDVASTLVAFSRNSEAGPEAINDFQETLIRLVSLLNALCLEGLENKQADMAGSGHTFEVLGFEDLRPDIQMHALNSKSRVEYVFQMIQTLVVDMIQSKVLSIAPPILSRSFQELGAGMVTYHEARKLSHVPIPPAYSFMTRVVLVCQIPFVPFMLADGDVTRGSFSAAAYTFMGIFLLWYINGLAQVLSNPFARENNTLDTAYVQGEFNLQLIQLLQMADNETPALAKDWNGRPKLSNMASATLHTIKTEHHLSMEVVGSFADNKRPASYFTSSRSEAGTLSRNVEFTCPLSRDALQDVPASPSSGQPSTEKLETGRGASFRRVGSNTSTQNSVYFGPSERSTVSTVSRLERAMPTTNQVMIPRRSGSFESTDARQAESARAEPRRESGPRRLSFSSFRIGRASKEPRPPHHDVGRGEPRSPGVEKSRSGCSSDAGADGNKQPKLGVSLGTHLDIIVGSEGSEGVVVLGTEERGVL